MAGPKSIGAMSDDFKVFLNCFTQVLCASVLSYVRKIVLSVQMMPVIRNFFTGLANLSIKMRSPLF